MVYSIFVAKGLFDIVIYLRFKSPRDTRMLSYKSTLFCNVRYKGVQVYTMVPGEQETRVSTVRIPGS